MGQGAGERRETIRINKWISDAGICSRREADRLIEAGRVTVDGVPAVPGTKVCGGQKVCVDGREAGREQERILLAVHKPAGVVCTTEKKWGDLTLEEMVHYPKRVYSVGRLDKNSEGLILMTNQGDILNKIMKAGNYHEKEYLVTVDKAVTPVFLAGMAGGVPLKELDTVTRPCRVEKAGEKQFRIVLTQGLNRQIRRMCEYFGYRVVRLVRTRIMNIELGRLPAGQYRNVSRQELVELMAGLERSANNPELAAQAGIPARTAHTGAPERMAARVGDPGSKKHRARAGERQENTDKEQAENGK